MGLITETQLRKQFTHSFPASYSLAHGDMLTPAAVDFLKDRGIEIEREQTEAPVFSKPRNKDNWETPTSFVNFYTKESLSEKPEAMTHLFENVLVYKDDPRIILRGKLDTLQAAIIESQIYFEDKQRTDLLEPLDDLLAYTRSILGCEVLNQVLPERKVLGWSPEEIRDRSHHPEKYFNLKQMVLVNRKQGALVSRLNYLRALSRESELVAVQCFRKGDEIHQNSLIQGLNRLSSCFHILMYKEL